MVKSLDISLLLLTPRVTCIGAGSQVQSLQKNPKCCFSGPSCITSSPLKTLPISTYCPIHFHNKKQTNSINICILNNGLDLSLSEMNQQLPLARQKEAEGVHFYFPCIKWIFQQFALSFLLLHPCFPLLYHSLQCPPQKCSQNKPKLLTMNEGLSPHTEFLLTQRNGQHSANDLGPHPNLNTLPKMRQISIKPQKYPSPKQ